MTWPGTRAIEQLAGVTATGRSMSRGRQFPQRKNEADKRVFELLSEKFQLFEGVFGASDEVLGAIESGVDFEKRIADIYQRCRQTEEIKAAFDQLQLELSLEINEAMTRTRKQLLENFDDEVREKLRVRDEDAKAYLNRYESLLMQLTRHELDGCAEFRGESAFRLLSHPFEMAQDTAPTGLYELPRRSGEAHLYRLNHPLAEAILARAKGRDLPPAEVCFRYGDHEGRVSILQPYIGTGGWLMLSQFSVAALDQAEDHLLFAAVTEGGEMLEHDTACRLLTLPGNVGQPALPSAEMSHKMESHTRKRQQEIQRDISERNARFFAEEADKLDGWAEDLKVGLERELREMDRQIKEARRAATLALTLEEKLNGQKQIKALESLRNQKRRSLFDAQDQVDRQREELIAQVEGKLKQTSDLQTLFTIRWQLA